MPPPMQPPSFQRPMNEQTPQQGGINPLMALLQQSQGPQNPQQPMMSQPASPLQSMAPAPMDISSMGGNLSDQLANMSGPSQTPPMSPVVDMYDNTPPIVKEAIQRRLFTKGM